MLRKKLYFAWINIDWKKDRRNIFLHCIIFLFRYSHVTADNRHEYVQLAKQFRLHEFDLAASAVREGKNLYFMLWKIVVFN